MTKDTPRKVRRGSPGLGAVYPYRGRFRGAVTWTEPDGRQRKRIVSGATRDEARAKLDEVRRELRLGTVAPDGLMTVADFLTTWIEDQRREVRPSTWRTSEMYVRVYLVPALGRLQLARLSARDVDRALDTFQREGRPVRDGDTRLRRPVSAVTAAHVRSALRHALNDAMRAGLVSRNAAADSKPPRVDQRPITYLSTRQLAKLLEATAECEFGPLYAIAATTGLRRGEILGLTWADVDGGVVRVRRSMGRTADGWGLGEVKSARSRRTLPLPATARQALETQHTRQRFAEKAAGAAWQNRDADLVFTDSVGRPLLPEYVSHRFGKDVRAAGVPRVRFHDLRHSAATALLAAGVPMAVISDWLGHSGIAITAAAYAAVVPELLADAADAIDRALGGAS